MKRALVVGAATVASAVLGINQAYGATTTSAYGWKLMTGVVRMDNHPWNVKFYNADARDRTTFYLKKTAARLYSATGVTFNVTTDIVTPTSSCPGDHTIVVKFNYDPDVYRSWANACNTNGTASGGTVTLGKVEWDNRTLSSSHGIFRKKVVSHEMGHAVGLMHPDTYPTGPSPLMRGDQWGGYSSYDYAEYYTGSDRQGFKALRTND